MQQYFRILGSGIYLPPHKVSAEEIDQRLQKPSGWTATHAQVVTRYECRSPESIATMAGNAARKAVENAQVELSTIDLIIDCSTSLYQPIPCNAAVYQAQLGPSAAGIPCIDVHGTCLGFLLALNVANGLFAARAYRRVLIVASEAALAGVNWNEPESASLMSDGAAAFVLERSDAISQSPTEPSSAVEDSVFAYRHQTFSEFLDACEVRSGAHRQGPFEYKPQNDADYRFHMHGSKLYRIARLKLPALVEQVLQQTCCPRQQVHIVPHQASPFAVESIRRLIEHPSERYYNRVAQMGNMVAASMPVILHQVLTEGLIRRGDHVMLLGTSAGYGQAACSFKY